MPKGIDLTGEKFGYWEVIEKIPRKKGEKGSIKWKCKCTKCNNEYIVSSDTLRNGTSTQCRKCSKDNVRIDYTGKTINGIYVFEKDSIHSNLKENYWRCKCPVCGREDWIVRGSHLKNSKTFMCKNCSSLENLKKIEKPFYKDLTNQRFGKLIAIKPTEKRNRTSIVWECCCDCGNICYVTSSCLINGDTSSCGLCSFRSKGELKIKELLELNNISYEREKPVIIEGHRYRFDFYISKDNYYIEYDGIQHFKETNFFKNSLKDNQKRDGIKNNWCKQNNIPLIRIPCTKYETLNIKDLLPNTSLYIV